LHELAIPCELFVMPEGDGRDRAAYELDGQLVSAARAGDDDAFAALFNRWFDSVFDAALRIVGNRDVAAEVAQDTFFVLWQKLDTLREPSTFGAFALRTARNRALNRSDRERRSLAVEHQDLVPVIDQMAPHDDTADLVTRREGDQLVWAASAALGAKDASILDLHLRHGLTAPELADELGVTPNNAHQLLFRMKKKLGVAIEAWVIWRGGTPSCERLVADLHAAGIDQFSAEAVRVVNTHVDRCDECGDRRAAVLAPEAMFAAVPIMVASPQLRELVAQGLRQQGVPMPAPRAASASTGTSATATATATQHTSAAGDPEPLPDPLPGPKRLALIAVGVLLLVLFIAAGLAITRGEPSAVVETATPGRPGTSLDAGGAARRGTSGAADDTADPSETVAVEGSAASTELELIDPTSTTTPADGAPNDPASSLAPPPGNPTTTPGGGGGGIITLPTTATTSPPPPPAAPVIDSFTGVTQSSAGCGSTMRLIKLMWITSNASSVKIMGPMVTNIDRAADGTVTTTACVPLSPQTYVLVASGPVAPPADSGPRTF
jgi:RNA polymerase sigma factor (sigma-70 family)